MLLTRKDIHNGDHVFYVKAVAATEVHTLQTQSKEYCQTSFTPQSGQVSEEDSDLKTSSEGLRDLTKRNLALLSHSLLSSQKATSQPTHTTPHNHTTSLPSPSRTLSHRNKTEDTTPRKPKRAKDYSYHKEKMMMCKQAEHGVPLQADWLADTDEEIDEQELEAHYSSVSMIDMTVVNVIASSCSLTVLQLANRPLDRLQSENDSNVFRKEREQYHEIQDLKAQMQDKNIAISELQKLIEKCKGKSMETQFDKQYRSRALLSQCVCVSSSLLAVDETDRKFISLAQARAKPIVIEV
ncbi:hypothetical protein Tco_0965819 [Tanacetum coccineum]